MNLYVSLVFEYVSDYPENFLLFIEASSLNILGNFVIWLVFYFKNPEQKLFRQVK